MSVKVAGGVGGQGTPGEKNSGEASWDLEATSPRPQVSLSFTRGSFFAGTQVGQGCPLTPVQGGRCGKLELGVGKAGPQSALWPEDVAGVKRGLELHGVWNLKKLGVRYVHRVSKRHRRKYPVTIVLFSSFRLCLARKTWYLSWRVRISSKTRQGMPERESSICEQWKL